tara:strand:- start:5378 stop:5740 length:363 start_codon:yes stop_codon:yes gene_type:complete
MELQKFIIVDMNGARHATISTFSSTEAKRIYTNGDAMFDDAIWAVTPEEYDTIHTIQDFDINLVDNVEIEGVDMADYPDFCDAFVSGADYDGVEMTEYQVIQMEENYPDWKYEQVENSLY